MNIINELITTSLARNRQYLPSKSIYEIVKFGTDTDKYENWFSKT